MDIEEIENKTESLGLYDLDEVGDMRGFSNKDILIEVGSVFEPLIESRPAFLISFNDFDQEGSNKKAIIFFEFFDNNGESIEGIIDRYKDMILKYNQENLSIDGEIDMDNKDGEIYRASATFSGNIDDTFLIVEYLEDGDEYNKEIIMVQVWLGNPM